MIRFWAPDPGWNGLQWSNFGALSMTIPFELGKGEGHVLGGSTMPQRTGVGPKLWDYLFLCDTQYDIQWSYFTPWSNWWSLWDPPCSMILTYICTVWPIVWCAELSSGGKFFGVDYALKCKGSGSSVFLLGSPYVHPHGMKQAHTVLPDTGQFLGLVG